MKVRWFSPESQCHRLDRSAHRARQLGDPRRAARLWLRAIELCNDYAEVNPALPTVYLWELAQTFRSLGHLGKAAVFYRSALARLPDEDPLRLFRGWVRSDLSELEWQRGDSLEARVLAENALSEIELAAGDGDVLLPSVLSRMGKLYAESGNLEKAQQCLLRATSIAGRILGQYHPDFLTCQANLAYLREGSERGRTTYIRRMGWRIRQ